MRELVAFIDENGEITTNEIQDTFKPDYGNLTEEEYYLTLKHGLETFNYYEEPTVFDTDIEWGNNKMYKVWYKQHYEIVSYLEINNTIERLKNYE